MIYYAKIVDALKKNYNYILPALVTEINSAKVKKRKDCHLAAWNLLSFILGDEIKSVFRANGRYYHKNLYISVSHSQNYVAVVVSCSPVGIDLEEYNPIKFNHKLYKRIALKNELVKLGETPNSSEIMLLWTEKEAYFKYNNSIFNPDTTRYEFINYVTNEFILTYYCEKLMEIKKAF